MKHGWIATTALVAVVLVGGVGFTMFGVAGLGDDPAVPEDRATADIDDEEPISITAVENATISGDVDAAAGTDLSVRLRSTDDGTSFLKSAPATVASDGRFEVTFDLSALESTRTATLAVYIGDEHIERTVSITPPRE